MACVSEKRGLLGPQPGDPDDGRLVVVRSAVASPRKGRLEDPLPQRAVLKRREEGLAGRVHEPDDVLARPVLGLGVLGQTRDLGVREAGELGPVMDHDGGGVLLVQDVLPAGRQQARKLGVHGLQARLVGIRQERARTDKVPMVALEEAQGLRIEAERRALLKERLDAREERGVQVDGVIVGRKLGGHRALYLLHLVVGVRVLQIEEDRRDASKQAARPLHGHDGVVKRGLLRIRGDGLHLLQLVRHPALEGGHVVGVRYPVEGREVVGKGALGEEGILGHGGLRGAVGRMAGDGKSEDGACAGQRNETVTHGVNRNRNP
jgi:hypothetical protein